MQGTWMDERTQRILKIVKAKNEEDAEWLYNQLYELKVIRASIERLDKEC